MRAMEMTEILARLDAWIAQQKADGASVSDQSLSLEATGSKDTIRNWRRAMRTCKESGATLDKLASVARAMRVSESWLIHGIDLQSHAVVDARMAQALRELTPTELDFLLAAAEGMLARRLGAAD